MMALRDDSRVGWRGGARRARWYLPRWLGPNEKGLSVGDRQALRSWLLRSWLLRFP